MEHIEKYAIFAGDSNLQAYVDNLNKLLPGSEYEGMTLEDIVQKAPAGAVFNNAGQILNHELYFTQFKPASEAVQKPEGALAAQIEKQWGSFEAFKAEFEAKGVGLFGSGWVWFTADADGNLVITQEANAANPVQRGLKPLLTFDVWVNHRLGGYRFPIHEVMFFFSLTPRKEPKEGCYLILR